MVHHSGVRTSKPGLLRLGQIGRHDVYPRGDLGATRTVHDTYPLSSASKLARNRHTSGPVPRTTLTSAMGTLLASGGFAAVHIDQLLASARY